ncbi:MAG: hypothetical protein H0X51_09060 [Parachlamydiaceae bacterium]|nr:hypothetical protein [Parachlamydiaceae bacterium]
MNKRPYFIQSCHFTLLELLISLVLTALLLTTLTYFYQQVEWLDTQSERSQKENFQVRYLETRLAKILPNALAEHELKKNFSFFTSDDLSGLLASQNPSLVFLFDNGASLDTKKANFVLARLYLDKNKQLCLATWPAPERWEQGVNPPVQKEVLMEHVESLRFSFFVPPERDRKLIQESVGAEKEEHTAVEPSVDKRGSWVSDWSRDYAYLPPLIKVTITRKLPNSEEAKTTTYAFPLSHSQKLIIYEQ